MRIKHFPSGPARTSSRTYIYIGVHALFPFTLFHAHFRIHCGGSWLSSAFNLLWITSCPASSPGEHSEWSSLLLCIYTLLPSRFGALRVKHTPSHPQPAKWRVMTPPARCNTLTKHCISRVNLLSVCKGERKREWQGGRGERSVAGERHATFICSLCIANHAYIMRPSSFMQIVWVLQQCLIHIHAAGGTWHLSAGRPVTLNLRVNVEHMQRGQGDYAGGYEMLFFFKGETLREMSWIETTWHSLVWF